MSRPVDSSVASRLHERLEALARISEEPDRLTRPFLTPSMRRAADTFAGWCREAGLSTEVDAVGNVRARWKTGDGAARLFLAIGSHLDTVRDAGRFDGALGALAALACVERLKADGAKLAFDLEVVGFADEEGLRFQTAYLGSGYYAGRFDEAWLGLKDRDGTSLSQALRDFGSDPAKVTAQRSPPAGLAGYLELHIEQGPVLEERDSAVGVVEAIAAQTRAAVEFEGKAGHAGTTPMTSRKDALCAAAEFVLAVERRALATAGLRATVGQARVEPGAGNVVPSLARVSADVRHVDDGVQAAAVAALQEEAQAIAARRRLVAKWETLQQTRAVPMHAAFRDAVAQACGASAPKLASGAGHDAVMLSRVCPVGMVFVRCRDGLSHHPDEFASREDIDRGLDAFAAAVADLGTGFRPEATGASTS